MSKVGKIFKTVTNFLGLTGDAPKINIPEAEIPPIPAPNAITDTGASLVTGSETIGNQRVSGRSQARRRRTGTPQADILGGLGSAGLRI